MSSARCLLLSLSYLAFAASVSQAGDDLTGLKLEKARQQYEKSSAQLKEKILLHLDEVEGAAKKSGKPEALALARESRASYESSGKIPNDAPVRLFKQANQLHKELEKACEAAIKAYTQEGNQKQAEEVKKSLARLQALSLERATRFQGTVFISAKNEVGYDLGKVYKNDRIRLSYVGGKWKGWGNIASDSPDEPTLEKGQRNRLAICEADSLGRTKVMVVVPPGTQHSPFEIVASRNFDRVVLRINDDDHDFATNPDGRVSYHVHILRGE